VEECRRDQADAVLEIAGTCFRYSRFHADPEIPDAVAHRIKREWISSYVRGERGERLLVATVDGRAAGFLAMMSSLEGDPRAGVVDLIGVGSDDQQRGVGTALIAAAVGRTQRGERLHVVTQASNLPSLSLYERCGFRVVRAGYVLHLHT
jgi:ribosomal protein S18 acetylase RimI-like enzyme